MPGNLVDIFQVFTSLCYVGDFQVCWKKYDRIIQQRKTLLNATTHTTKTDEPTEGRHGESKIPTTNSLSGVKVYLYDYVLSIMVLYVSLCAPIY